MTDLTLSAEQIRQFEEDGYLILENLLDPLSGTGRPSLQPTKEYEHGEFAGEHYGRLNSCFYVMLYSCCPWAGAVGR